MGSFRYKEFSDTRFDVVGKDEVIVATVERGGDYLWHVVPSPAWDAEVDLSPGPFNTSEDALDTLGAVLDDQS